jgi:hypothetical protein
MKRNYNILLLTLLLAFASCSFTAKTFDDPDKDKLLVQLITYVLEQGHFQPKNIDDNFSSEVFKDYLEQIDPFKRYFYKSDIEEFEAYKDQIDDQLINYDLTFFNLTNERLLKRIEESKMLYKISLLYHTEILPGYCLRPSSKHLTTASISACPYTVFAYDIFSIIFPLPFYIIFNFINITYTI